MSVKTLHPRFILVNLILPFNLFIAFLLLFLQLGFMQRTVDHNGLKTRKFLHAPLLSIMEGREGYEPPLWLGLVALNSGEIKYISDYRKNIEYLQNDLPVFKHYIINRESMTREDLDLILANIVKKVPEQITILSFQYKGQDGMVMYLHDYLPIYVRIIVKPVYLLYIFAMTLVLFFLGVLQMNSHRRSIESLIEASRKIKNRDLDSQIRIRHRTEMKQVFEAFDQMRRGLKAHRERESRFIMSVTHDLKTPLSAMRMYLEAMKDGYIEVSDEARTAIEKTLVKSSILESRIRGLLEYKRIEKETHEIAWENIELLPWLSEQDALFEEECRLNGRNYMSEITIKSGISIKGNREMLERALQNLIDNGCCYTRDEDTLIFRAFVEEEKIRLAIEDNGPGINEEDRDKIFELFYRADKGRNNRGMGIGLAAVKSIIESHGGAISYSDSSQGGASFRINLPLAL